MNVPFPRRIHVPNDSLDPGRSTAAERDRQEGSPLESPKAGPSPSPVASGSLHHRSGGTIGGAPELGLHVGTELGTPRSGFGPGRIPKRPSAPNPRRGAGHAQKAPRTDGRVRGPTADGASKTPSRVFRSSQHPSELAEEDGICLDARPVQP